MTSIECKCITLQEPLGKASITGCGYRQHYFKKVVSADVRWSPERKAAYFLFVSVTGAKRSQPSSLIRLSRSSSLQAPQLASLPTHVPMFRGESFHS